MGSHELSIKVGDVVAGKYKIDSILGRGGMGMVVAAKHLHLDQNVALKFMLPAAVSNKDALERFYREARAAFRLTNEHVARVLDVGTLDDGAPYIVMEYMAGCNMADLLESEKVLPVPVAVDLILQACEAIAEAHALGMVHRDLKPGNLFLTTRPDGSPFVKVLDFGISKLTTELMAGGAALTQTNRTMGSPHYMSPEQIASAKDVDARSDIWSLGVILFELTTGRVPFEARSIPEVCVQVMRTPAPKLTGPNIPEAFGAIVGRCLEKNPAHRYPNVGELAETLAFFSESGARTSLKRIGGVTHLKRSTESVPVRQLPEGKPRPALSADVGLDATIADPTTKPGNR